MARYTVQNLTILEDNRPVLVAVRDASREDVGRLAARLNRADADELLLDRIQNEIAGRDS